MRILLDEHNLVKEIIPEINPELPGIPVERRYPAKFLETLLVVADDTEVLPGWEYDSETGTFFDPTIKKEEESESKEE